MWKADGVPCVWWANGNSFQSNDAIYMGVNTVAPKFLKDVNNLKFVYSY